MKALNKQALREAAIHAQSSDDWGYDGDNFHDKATPDAVLMLLDELDAAEKRIAELESAFPDGWQFEECESEGCENGAIFNVGTGINNIHVCEKCASEERYFRLKKSALPKRLPFKFAAGIGVKGE